MRSDDTSVKRLLCDFLRSSSTDNSSFARRAANSSPVPSSSLRSSPLSLDLELCRLRPEARRLPPDLHRLRRREAEILLRPLQHLLQQRLGRALLLHRVRVAVQRRRDQADGEAHYRGLSDVHKGARCYGEQVRACMFMYASTYVANTPVRTEPCYTHSAFCVLTSLVADVFSSLSVSLHCHFLVAARRTTSVRSASAQRGRFGSPCSPTRTA